MIRLWRFLSVAIVLAVCLGLVVVPAMVSANPGDCWLEIDPAATTVGFNEAFDVNVTMKNPNATDINTIMCHINFTASLVEVTGVDCGATVGSPFTLTLAGPSWDNTTGWVDYDAGCPSGTSTNLTSVVYATIHMKSKGASGIATIEFVPGTVSEPETAVIDTDSNDQTDWASVVNGTVTVSGAPVLPVLKVDVSPAGKGTVKANGVTLTGYPNTTNWTTGDNVTLEAVAVAGWAFLNWTGNLTGSTNPTNITMDSDKNVTAHFTELPPALNVTPILLTFSANVGGNVTNKTLQICNGGGGILNWTANITYSAVTGWTFGWLSMSPMNGTNLANGTCNSTQVAVNTNGLTEGIYYANITINSTDTGVVNKTVPVTLNVGLPAIEVSPTSLTFTTNEGENPPDQMLAVCNTGTGTLNWSLNDTADWLSENPTSGSLGADECEDVTVSVDAGGMEAGDYSATITITGSPTKTIPVSLHIVSAMPELPVAPASLSASGLSISPHQVKPDQEVTISINVANTGGETGSYNAILYINSAVEDSQTVSVAPGMTKNVIFTVTKSDAGVYDVLIAGQSGQFTVVHTGWFGGGLGTGGIVAIVVIVIVLIVALVFVLRGTRRAV